MDIDLASAGPPEPRWAAVVRKALAKAPDPEAATKLAESVLREIPAGDLDAVAAGQARELAAVLYACCGVAPFLGLFLRRHPDWLCDLAHSDLAEPRDREGLEASATAALRGAGDAEAALRQFKYFELARITARDVDPEWVPLERSASTVHELSLLADVLLDAALGIASNRVAQRFGPPVWRDDRGAEVPLGLSVLGLGKLGAQELNYSSDVDLVYVTESAATPLSGGPGDMTPDQYFTRIAREFGPLVQNRTADGFLYRVDLELRPGGSEGPLLATESVLARYYETAAATWEMAAFMKARPIAGDLALGWRAIRAVSPIVYSSAMDIRAARDIKALKERIESERGALEDRFDVKIDAGGIRDVEFVAQTMQLLHGGRIPQLRERSTLRGLQALVDVKLLPADEVDQLSGAYLFLRRLENRLQMEQERQTHKLPTEGGARHRLARSMGFLGDEPAADLDGAIEGHRSLVKRSAEQVFSDGGRAPILDLFARAVPSLMTFPASRGMLEDLAERFASAIDASSDPERALNNLDRFVRGVGAHRFYYELLLDRPELVPRLAALFAASRFLSDILSRQPRLIEPVFRNPDTLLLSRSELRADLASLRSKIGAEDSEGRLAALRLFRHRHVLNIGLLDVAQKVTLCEVEAALSELAETCLEDALDFASAQRPLEGTEFLVVGMGKLGSRELGYGSDLDLIFVYDPGEGGSIADGQNQSARLAQRLISLLQTPTAEGFCYEIDARMRPSGNQGPLVTSLASFERYHETQALPWERQALLRARPVAGSEALASRYDALRSRILSMPLPDDLREEVHRVRMRMENELARETGKRRDFKTGRGGVLDVENILQYLRLLHGVEHPALLEPIAMNEQFDALERLAVLDETSLSDLRNGWEFLRALGSRLRIVENRSISDLDEERGDLDGLALRLGYAAGSHQAGPRRALLRDYTQHTDSIRAVYDQVFA